MRIFFTSIFILFLLSGANAQTVTVNFAQPDTVNNMLGFIHGMASTQPADSAIQKLHPAFWRAGTLTNQIYQRATNTFGTYYILATSDYYGYPQGNPNWIPPYMDTTYYNHFIDSLCTLTSNINVIYQPWNEPDGSFFWTGTNLQLFQTFVRAEHHIRQNLGAGVAVIGPSIETIDTTYIRNFCNYCLANNVQLDYLSWHWFFNDVNVYYIEDALNWATTQFVNNPAYASLHIKGVIIDEMTSSIQHYQPAHYLANLYYLEKGKALGAVHACWDALDGSGTSNCWNNTIDGLLTTTSKQPRAVWWAAKCYSETVGNRVVSTSTSPEIISFGGTNPFYQNESDVLIAHYARQGFTPSMSVNVQLNNLNTTGFIANGDSVQVTVYKIPNDSINVVTTLPFAAQQVFYYNGQTVSFSLPPLSIKEAYWLTITKVGALTSIDKTTEQLNTPVFYPNPVNHMLLVKLTDNASNVLVYDCLGKEIHRQSASGANTEVDFSNFPSGIYFILVISDNGTYTQKISKE